VAAPLAPLALLLPALLLLLPTPLRIFSNHTPAKPEVRQAMSTQTKPSMGLCAVSPPRTGRDLCAAEASSSVSETPSVRMTRETHLARLKARFRSTTEKSAVVRILSW
jgi:hypothetical protein